MLRSESLVAADPLHPWIAKTCDTTASTNTIVKDLIRSVPARRTSSSNSATCFEDNGVPYFVATSLVQTGGYGRQGRVWASPLGGLYLSLGLPYGHTSSDSLSTMSLVSALALKHVLDVRMPHNQCAIKWPNDVLVDGGKICGISLESLNGYLCIGIGLNVFHPEGEPIDSRYSVRYLVDYLNKSLLENKDDATPFSYSYADSMVDQGLLECLACDLLKTMGAFFDQWITQGFCSFKADFEACMSFRGALVDIELIDGSSLVQGTICGIDEQGQLVLDCNGKRQRFASGEVHVKKTVL